VRVTALVAYPAESLLPSQRASNRLRPGRIRQRRA
jgi:hypothetical protein